MKVKVLLHRRGIFSRLDRGGHEVRSADFEYVYLWRKVLDELLIGLIGTNTSASNHSMRWFNSNPGDVDYYIDDHTDTEVKVDLRAEFEDVCSLAALHPELVTTVANKVYERAKNEK